MSKFSLDSLANTFDLEIARFQRCRGWLRRLDEDAMRAARKVFASDIEFARWLASPQPEFQGRIPIELMVTRWDKGLVTGTLLQMSDERRAVGRTDIGEAASIIARAPRQKMRTGKSTTRVPLKSEPRKAVRSHA